ncbi:hypothetical protein GCM10025868_01330 [Angustibacter aerolatus]|uniref:Transcriptional regulator LacI/GalR-like sensor domain-containing protein n=1 Tax=Angustibacter aerolatus TaxID=1162965 RepID=A0ABQ6J9M5_9ACTN|nr:hypothetical protein GCM10025868_01330 [Angustibacter aerolatus]
MLVASTHRDPERERAVVAQMLQRRVSGLLLVPTAGDHAWLETRSPRTPMVLVDRAAPGVDADLVAIDDAAAARGAVEHLLAHGHRRIGYVGDHPDVPTSAARLAGYRDALTAHGLDVDELLVRADCPDPVTAGQATRDLLSRNGSAPTALLSAATRCSLGVVPALHATGRTDVALVGFGDFAMADALQPGVTVVDHSAAAVGLAAAERLTERLADPGLPTTTTHVPVRLLQRGSGEPAGMTVAAVIGVDVGTTTSKALVRSDDGRRSRSSRPAPAGRRRRTAAPRPRATRSSTSWSTCCAAGTSTPKPLRESRSGSPRSPSRASPSRACCSTPTVARARRPSPGSTVAAPSRSSASRRATAGSAPPSCAAPACRGTARPASPGCCGSSTRASA